MTVAKKKRSKNENLKAVVKRHNPCASEFDYQGWSGWGEWRREEQKERCKEDGKRDCWRCCNFPSECRWGSHIGTMLDSAEALASIAEGTMSLSQVPLKISHQDEQASDEYKDQYSKRQQPPTTFDGILEGLELPRDKQREQAPRVLKEDFWSEIPALTLKRKGGRGKSPLGTIVEDEESGHTGGSLEGAEFMSLDVVVASKIEKPEDAVLRMPAIDELPGFEDSLAKFQTAFEEFGAQFDRTKLQK